jgi:dGTPase
VVIAPPLAYEDDAWTRFFELRRKDDDERSEAEIDRSRIIHSGAFRRLQGKTQVFGVNQDAHFRTRLTHSLEVAQIAKGLALRTGANRELCEAASLAHDIGHPPFGHKGEEVLGELMKPHGGFEANAQNFRVLQRIEVKYSDESVPGLNLTRAVLDALLKYRDPYPGDGKKFYYTDDPTITGIVEWARSGESRQPLECQIMDWADDIAYSVHDLEDGLRAGMISSRKVERLWDRILSRARDRLEDCSNRDLSWAYEEVVKCERGDDERALEAVRKTNTSSLINYFLKVPVTAVPPGKTATARHGAMLDIGPERRRRCEVLKSLAFELLVDDPRVATLEVRAKKILSELFEVYVDGKAAKFYPQPFRTEFEKAESPHHQARIACDFISGMTDEYAERVYTRMLTPVRMALGDY